MTFESLRTGGWIGEEFLSLWTPPLQTMTEMRIEPSFEINKLNSQDSPYSKSLNLNEIQHQTEQRAFQTTSHSEPHLKSFIKVNTSSSQSAPACSNVAADCGHVVTSASSGTLQCWWDEGANTVYSPRVLSTERHATLGYGQPTSQKTSITSDFAQRNCPITSDGGNRDRFQSRLLINFLPAEERISDGGTKFGRVAETIRLQDGTLKLFAERGRLIETRITFEPVGVFMNEPFRLRFTPYSSCAGVEKPVIGYHNQMQKTSYIHTDQLCFIQLGVSGQVNPGHCQYETNPEGYLSMIIPLLGNRSIYPLVFPFHNSQCPSSCRKTVCIRVSVLRSDESEICASQFQVVSCASPIRDIQRFQARHLTGKQSVNNTTPGKAIHDDRCKVGPSETVQFNSKNNTPAIELDISPSSSGFASSGSPPHCYGTTDEDGGEGLVRDSVSRTTYTENIIDRGPTDFFNQVQPNLHEYGNNEERAWDQQTHVGTLSDALGTTNEEQSNGLAQNAPVGQQEQRTVDSCLRGNRTFGMNGQHIPEDSTDGGEYVIKTKSRRIYRILRMLEKELSAMYGHEEIGFKRMRSDCQ